MAKRGMSQLAARRTRRCRAIEDAQDMPPQGWGVFGRRDRGPLSLDRQGGIAHGRAHRHDARPLPRSPNWSIVPTAIVVGALTGPLAFRQWIADRTRGSIGLPRCAVHDVIVVAVAVIFAALRVGLFLPPHGARLSFRSASPEETAKSGALAICTSGPAIEHSSKRSPSPRVSAPLPGLGVRSPTRRARSTKASMPLATCCSPRSLVTPFATCRGRRSPSSSRPA